MKKSNLTELFINLLSKKVSKRIVVFESDDWGSIRMPSKLVLDKLLTNNVISQSPYARYDSIATDDDWNALLETLTSFKDDLSNYPVFTQNFIMANPDFEKIKSNNFSSYFDEPFDKTIKNYKHTKDYLTILDQAISSKIVKPQFHGNQHVNIFKWLNLLQKKDKNALLSFDQKTYFIDNFGKSIFASYDYNSIEELPFHEKSLKDGLDSFREYFDFSSDTMIFPNYIWSKHHLNYISNFGVKGIQGTKIQNIPRDKLGYSRKIRCNGYLNDFDQITLVRNCFFEPSSSKSGNSVDNCIKSIDNAFMNKVPAVVSTHRLNYIGRLSETNRKNNLKKLKELLTQITKKWPDVVFMSSDELVNLYRLRR